MKAIVNANVADLRIKPSHRSERTSQGLFDEIVEIKDEIDQFFCIEFNDGYQGWMAKQFLTENAPFDGDGPYIIDSNIAPAYAGPNISARRLTNLPYGCQVYGKMNQGFLNAETARWGAIFVPKEDLIDKNAMVAPRRIGSEEIAREADKFLGAPYLWGGRSFFGFDCSGFVKAIAARFGIELPRDSKDQMKVGLEIGRDDVRAGDLLFFKRHVALAIFKDLFIHCSRGNGGVDFNSLSPVNPRYSANLDKAFITARRIFS